MRPRCMIALIALAVTGACGGRHRQPSVSPIPHDAVVADATATDGKVVAPNDAIARCSDNLCGMDSYCSCSGTRGNQRCWSDAADCEVDAACCAARPGYRNGLRLDECADETAKARKARDAKTVSP